MNETILQYPQDFHNKIICGDHLSLLPQIPDGSIDLTVTSPPYDNLREYKGYTFDFPALATELYRVTKDGGVVVWVVGDATINGSETGTSFRQALGFMDIGFNLHDTMIYQKGGQGAVGSNLAYWQSFEYMFILSKGKPKTVNLLKDRKNRWTGSWGKVSKRQQNGSLKKQEKIACSEYGIRFNIWRFNTGKGYSTEDEEAHQHPAIFPEALAQDHILSWSNEGDIVLDPMCGSGTTCKAAVKLKRRYIGMDTSRDYCAIAEQRIKAELSQPDLPMMGGGK